jgi:hypothetical protein
LRFSVTLAPQTHGSFIEGVQQDGPQSGAVDLRPLEPVAVMVEEQRTRRIIEPVALVLRPGMGEEGRLKSGQAQRPLPRFHMEVQRAALLAIDGIRIALEYDGPCAADLQQAREHKTARPANDRDAR